MADGGFPWTADGGSPAQKSDGTAYRDGYQHAMRELSWARTRGFVPTERQLVRALMQALKVYHVVSGGKSIAGRHPDWLRGRADALRTLLRQNVGAMPVPGDEFGD